MVEWLYTTTIYVVEHSSVCV